MALFPTVQDVLNKVWQEFVVNGRKRAVNEVGKCMYRGSTVDIDGDVIHNANSPVRCAIGVCIPDDLYDPEMENHVIAHIKNNWPEVYEEVFNGIDIFALSRLQSAHDNTTATMREQLEDAAKALNLTIPTTT